MNQTTEHVYRELDALPDFFSAEDLLRVLPISRSTAYRLSTSGAIPCLRVGKRILFSREHLKTWVEQEMGEGILK